MSSPELLDFLFRQSRTNPEVDFQGFSFEVYSTRLARLFCKLLASYFYTGVPSHVRDDFVSQIDQFITFKT